MAEFQDRKYDIELLFDVYKQQGADAVIRVMEDANLPDRIRLDAADVLISKLSASSKHIVRAEIQKLLEDSSSQEEFALQLSSYAEVLGYFFEGFDNIEFLVSVLETSSHSDMHHDFAELFLLRFENESERARRALSAYQECEHINLQDELLKGADDAKKRRDNSGNN